MILLRKTDSFEVTFYTHHTHEIDVKHVDLSEKTCETIAGLLKSGFPQQYILDYYRTKPLNHRDRYVRKTDLKRIANRYRLNHAWRSHSEDAKSVHLFVQQNPDLVLFYQPEVKNGDETPKEFILVLMTERQVKYIQDKRQFRVICVDTTHNVGSKKRWPL